jgi:hypothetical protein
MAADFLHALRHGEFETLVALKVSIMKWQKCHGDLHEHLPADQILHRAIHLGLLSRWVGWIKDPSSVIRNPLSDKIPPVFIKHPVSSEIAMGLDKSPGIFINDRRFQQ